MVETRIEGLTAHIRLIPQTGQFTLLDVETIKEIIKNLRMVKESPAKCLRIYGEGGCFAVGADLRTLSTYDGFDAKWFSMLGNTMFGTMRTMPQVVIAEIDGFCMGGGMDFAAACDFRYATGKSKFAHPGSKLGIITGFGGTQAIPRLMKSACASEFLITGNAFDTDYMLKGGFLKGVAHNTEELMHMTGILCEKINRKSRTLLSGFKLSLNGSAGI
ncbi:enoyl-CoA hydratase/isomerase family protein [Seleniivibrio woodruffii]|uniref:Enoyl-CoA hydratase n=1 Tax=Seleniivibrio woodruffii TaxID=1078050 RepID=A0A4R1KCP3_9BACT|nr:enoyl-CoA hydratase/isomerase family protein [Seleniivibrio woodruffii]TCK61820.1 enoyl-CoA hydratase [Seleniivibrio woodruffii]TVZ35065.1 enoyl-CoA hydratase [Seleniivibrio woodruffii]